MVLDQGESPSIDRMMANIEQQGSWLPLNRNQGRSKGEFEPQSVRRVGQPCAPGHLGRVETLICRVDDADQNLTSTHDELAPPRRRPQLECAEGLVSLDQVPKGCQDVGNRPACWDLDL